MQLKCLGGTGLWQWTVLYRCN